MNTFDLEEGADAMNITTERGMVAGGGDALPAADSPAIRNRRSVNQGNAPTSANPQPGSPMPSAPAPSVTTRGKTVQGNAPTDPSPGGAGGESFAMLLKQRRDIAAKDRADRAKMREGGGAGTGIKVSKCSNGSFRVGDGPCSHSRDSAMKIMAAIRANGG